MEVEIRPEWGQNGKDSFGRWLGVVYVDGVDINAEMREKAHAVKYEERDCEILANYHRIGGDKWT